MTPEDWEHGKLVIQETGGWIKNADTKSTILAGSFGLSLTFIVPRLLAAVPDVTAVPFSFGLWISAAAVLLVSALTTGYGIGIALVPRTSPRTSVTNRFAWPSLAMVSAKHLPPPKASADEIRAEVWEQAASLARIAAAKYRSFKIALAGFCIYLAAAVTMITIPTVANLFG